jgi:hypothetical protein
MTGSTSALDDAKRDRHVGWAFQAMESAFKFSVDDLQYRVGDARLHQEGSYLTFVGSNAMIAITYEEWWNGFCAFVTSTGGGHENVWEVLARKDPDGTRPAPDRTERISREDATRILLGWADGLRSVAADVL